MSISNIIWNDRTYNVYQYHMWYWHATQLSLFNKLIILRISTIKTYTVSLHSNMYCSLYIHGMHWMHNNLFILFTFKSQKCGSNGHFWSSIQTEVNNKQSHCLVCPTETLNHWLYAYLKEREIVRGFSEWHFSIFFSIRLISNCVVQIRWL